MPAPVDITDPFRALSDPTRREIVSLLAKGALPVRLIAGHFPEISRPAVSKHLRILREGRLVTEERSGRERYYRLERATVETTLDWMAGVSARAAGKAAGASGTGKPGEPVARGRGRAVQPGSRRGRRARRRGDRLEPEGPGSATGQRGPAEADPAPSGSASAEDSDDWKAW